MLCAVAIQAVPAYPGTIQVRQPDGSFITLRLLGDEWLNFNTTVDGYSVVKDKRGYYVYAEKKDGRLQATSRVAHDVAERSVDEQTYLAGVKKYQMPQMGTAIAALKSRMEAEGAKRRAQGRASQYDFSKFKGLIVLVQFNDKEFSRPDDKDILKDMVNHEGYTGQGFFNIENSAYSTATYKLTSDQSASNARVMIRYSFQGNTNRDMKITIDNGTYDVAFPSTGSWDKWDTAYIEDVWVDALDFKMKIASTTSDGGPNIDMIDFDMKGVYRTGCKPAKVENDVESSSSTTSFVNPVAMGASFDVKNLSVTTPGGLMEFQLMDAMGKTLKREVRNVAPGAVSLLSDGENLAKGRYFARISLNGRLFFLQPFVY